MDTDAATCDRYAEAQRYTAAAHGHVHSPASGSTQSGCSHCAAIRAAADSAADRANACRHTDSRAYRTAAYGD